jgi:hypothetical protein
MQAISINCMEGTVKGNGTGGRNWMAITLDFLALYGLDRIGLLMIPIWAFLPVRNAFMTPYQSQLNCESTTNNQRNIKPTTLE